MSMQSSMITMVLNGNTYRLNANDRESIGKLSKEDKQQLLALLEAIKQEEKLSEAAVQQALNKAKLSTSNSASILCAAPNSTGQANMDGLAKDNSANGGTISPQGTDSPQGKPERLGAGDVDALMSRLILEEKQNQKPGMTSATIYKWAAGIVVAIVAIAFLF